MYVVITGGSKGFGKAIAKKFAAKGDTIILCARNLPALQMVKDELEKEYPTCTVHIQAANMGEKEAVKKFAIWILEQGFVPDILVNNAGIFFPGSVHSEEEGVLEEILNVNLFGVYHLTRAILPSMMKKKSGHIFNMCSIASLQAYANGGAYSISKFALLGFSKNLREEMKPHGIKVTAVLPGAAYTDSWAGSGISPERIMEANDIAEMVFAASQLSPMAVVEDIVMRPLLGDL